MPLDGQIILYETPALILLREGRERIEASWCQRTGHDAAVCIITAMQPWTTPLGFEEARAALCEAAGLPPNGRLEKYNDAPGRTKAEVVAVYDRAAIIVQERRWSNARLEW